MLSHERVAFPIFNVMSLDSFMYCNLFFLSLSLSCLVCVDGCVYISRSLLGFLFLRLFMNYYVNFVVLFSIRYEIPILEIIPGDRKSVV